MRTRNQSKQLGEDDRPQKGDSGTSSNPGPKSHDEEGGLLDRVSKEAVGKLLDRVHSRKGGRKECRPSENTKVESILGSGLKSSVTGIAEKSASHKGEFLEGSVNCDANEMDWEEGTIPIPESHNGYSFEDGREVTVEFPSSSQKKRPRRVSAEDKQLAELVHKVHLLCLLARGRLVDRACNDPLIQASLLSLLPTYLLKLSETPRVKANMLGSLVNWFHNVFHVRNQSVDRGSFQSNIAYALEAREGTAEEIAALSVALFRALDLRTRFVSILDVASLKPNAEISGILSQDVPRLDTRIYSSPSTISCSDQTRASNFVASHDTSVQHDTHESQSGRIHKKDCNSTSRTNLLENENLDNCPIKTANASRRKGDVEFQLQMEMALTATAAGTTESKLGSEFVEQSSWMSPAPPSKGKKTNPAILTPGSSTTVWSRKSGPPSCWAEVYCSLETMTGRWVHIDAANGIVDGEGKVEAAAVACRRPLKYVVAFAGNGAKDVTRRYCMQWYKIIPRRISSEWWDAVLAPLKELESAGTGGPTHMEGLQENSSSQLEKKSSEVPSTSVVLCSSPIETCSSQNYPNNKNSQLSINESRQVCEESNQFVNGISLEDMELETRALTEPLPTNQLAYKCHQLYAIERWLTKHQILHPKGPILGFCSGHAVYPRSCVQTLQTKHRWLREGLQVRANEIPAKVVKRLKKKANVQISNPNISEEEDDGGTTIELYGKWQLEELQLPHAVNGIVPKNEWGRVDVWSEKCLPPGTVHLRLPRILPVARRLAIDCAPAMVGFEFRNGHSFPVYEGIVVCTEFRDAILEAYREEEERRESEERRRDEAQALSRWFQLLSSIVTRQRLENAYIHSSSVHTSQDPPSCTNLNRDCAQSNSLEGGEHSSRKAVKNAGNSKSILPLSDDHEHVFPIVNQSFDNERMVRMKRCPCGFSIEVEEL